MPKLIFLYGHPGCGKLTIAKELAALTSFKLFHNHLTVDLLLSLFDFGSPQFIKYRESLWLELIGEAIRNGSDIIFTFCPENTVSKEFIKNMQDTVHERRGTCHFVNIVCPVEELVQRVEQESRKQYQKLSSGKFLLQLLAGKAHDYGGIIPTDLLVDSGVTEPNVAAQLIVEKFGI